ncbi:hypothetical protein FNH22_05295 [Fulvivirga sp. M361]|uniref:sensor histidine kinase n=1 Tax=Fulvivirga sp. M361 TaxID=2594266 RepID=UPI001179DA04|nr:histidine kinase [Fulvivirga sp. M361]TRX60468.1 hypothetical protein FNH22_05295 [Fulvivirga sp. M361]
MTPKLKYIISYVRERIPQWFFIPLLYLLFRDEKSLQNWNPDFVDWEPWIAMGYIYILWEGNRYVGSFWNKRLPGFEFTIRRLVWQMLSCTLFILLFCLLFLGGFRFFEVMPSISFRVFKDNFLYGLLVSYLIIAVYEGVDFYQGWKVHLTKAEKLAREKSEIQLALVDAQLSALRDQLNPHFLFNSLNTLSSLIDLKNKKAITYLEQLADVYRYLLEHRARHLISLKEELTFAQAYISLNKSRFRDDLAYKVMLNTKDDDVQLPPYALQLMLENAIKHNAISPGNPLVIVVTDTPDHLVITNNKRAKSVLEPSTGMGLKNLKRRCIMATGKPLQVIESEDSFTVKVPFVHRDAFPAPLPDVSTLTP